MQFKVVGIVEDVRPKKNGAGSYVTIKGINPDGGTDTFNCQSDDNWGDIPVLEKVVIEGEMGGRVFSGEKGPNQSLYLRKVTVKPFAPAGAAK